jgi:hypothetical protein
MRLRTRFSLIAGGIVIFLILAPLIVLYARGFKYDFESGKLLKTGTLVVKTDPSKTQVFLNDDSTGVEAPINIRFLLPGDYTIKITKDGYQTWIKHLPINSQFVTWAAGNNDKLFLFFNEAKEIGNWAGTDQHISSDQSEIVFKSADRTYLLRTEDGSIDNLGEASSIKLPFLPRGTSVHWTNANQIWQLLQTAEHWPLSPLQFTEIEDVGSTGDHTAILLNSDLYLMDVSKTTLIDKSVSTFTIDDQGVWYISQGELKQYSFTQGNSRVIASDIPSAQQAQIIRADNQLYLILDNELYQLNDTLQKIYGPVTFARWENDAKKLLYGNDNEIYLYNPLTQTTQLALRSLTPITNAQLNWKTGYVFYQNEGQIKAAELDTRSGQNQFNLLSFGTARNFIISPDGTRLFVIYPDAVKVFTIR